MVHGRREAGARVASILQPLSSTPAIAVVAPRDIDASFLSRRKIRSDTIQACPACQEVGIFLNQRHARPAARIVPGIAASSYGDSARLDNVTALFRTTTINRLIPSWLTGVTLRPIIPYIPVRRICLHRVRDACCYHLPSVRIETVGAASSMSIEAHAVRRFRKWLSVIERYFVHPISLIAT